MGVKKVSCILSGIFGGFRQMIDWSNDRFSKMIEKNAKIILAI